MSAPSPTGWSKPVATPVIPSPKVEGMPLCDWVLLDAQNAIVHIFRPDVRQFYNLEKMWSADRPGEAAKS